MYSPSTQGLPFDPLLTPFNLIHVLLPVPPQEFLKCNVSITYLLFLWRFSLFWGRELPGLHLRLELQNYSFLFPIPLKFWLHASSVGFTQHAHRITRHLLLINVGITLCKLWSSSLCNFPHILSNYFKTHMFLFFQHSVSNSPCSSLLLK
jgi:hypothetical protein